MKNFARGQKNYNVVCAKKSIEKHTVDDEIYYILEKKLIENKKTNFFFHYKKKDK
jgi:hypothetical protein